MKARFCAGAALCGLLAATAMARAPQSTDLNEASRAPGTLLSFENRLAPVAAADSAFHPWNLENGADPPNMGAAMRAEYDALSTMLSDSLRASFLGLSSDDWRREWLRRYWVLRDPTPTTPENERRDEHDRRTAYAKQHYATEVRPYFDARGAFYIRFGPPAAVHAEPPDVRIGLGYVAKSETWVYSDGMEARFEQSMPGLPFELGHSGAHQSNRPDLTNEVVTNPGGLEASAHDADRPQLSELAPSVRAWFLDGWAPSEGAILAVTAMESGLEHFELPSAPPRFLPALFDADVFRGVGMRPRVEVHVQFTLQDLHFEFLDALWRAGFRLEGVLYDAALREAARDEYEDVVTARAEASTHKATLWPAQLQFDVVPGLYRLALRVEDQGGGAAGTFVADVRVPEFPAGRLALSDLELATFIGTTADSGAGRFVKHDRVVVPNPVALYRRGKQLTAYFEIYGLHVDATGHSRYEVSYALVQRETARRGPGKDRNAAPYVRASFNGVADRSDPVEEIHLDVSAVKADAYDLVVTVRDLLDGMAASATTRTRVRIGAWP